MKYQIEWNIFAIVTTAPKCDRAIQLFETMGDFVLRDIQRESYHKGQVHYKIKAITDLEFASPQTGYFEIMKKAGSLAHTWVIGSPSDTLEFSAVSYIGAVSVKGIECIMFEVIPNP